MHGKWITATLAGLLFSASALADRKHQNNHRYDNRYDHRSYGYQHSAPGWYRPGWTPFSHNGYDRRVRVYPRHNPPRYNRYWRQQARQYQRAHYHRYRPRLEIHAHFDQYSHCPGHGGYFHVDDFYYR